MKVFWVCMENLLTTSWPLVSAALMLFLEEKCGRSENTTREERSVSSRDNSLSHSVSSHRGRQVCGHTSEEWLTSPSQLKWSPSVKQAQNWCTVLTPQGSGSGSQIICCSKCSLRAPLCTHLTWTLCLPISPSVWLRMQTSSLKGTRNKWPLCHYIPVPYTPSNNAHKSLNERMDKWTNEWIRMTHTSIPLVLWNL